jgi:hypothetical protein
MGKFMHTLVKPIGIRTPGLLVTALILILTACSSGGTQANTVTPTTGSSNSSPQQSNLPIVALPGYHVSLFASAAANYSAPDSVVADGGHIFIDYQNVTAKNCTDNNTSTIVEYTMDGKVVKTFTMPGHSDGMRVDPSSHLLWVTSCEDGNPKMATIDPNSGTVTPYTFPPTAHGGGYDDLYFLNGKTFLTASNPSLDKNGNNVFPALYSIMLGNGKVSLTPVLMGNASATDNTLNTKITLNLVDPDSLSVDSTNNDLILINQGGSQIIFLSNPGTPQQKVTSTTVGTQLDDTVWASSAQGRLLITDGTSGNTYWLSTTFKPGSVYTQTPDDSGVAGLVAHVDPTSGTISAVAIGFGKPTGMIFVPNS